MQFKPNYFVLNNIKAHSIRSEYIYVPHLCVLKKGSEEEAVDEQTISA